MGSIIKFVPKLILNPFITYEIYDEIYHDGWKRLVECLEKYAQNLSRPKGITSPIDVIPPITRHRLWLQDCFDPLSGLGQEDDLTLVEEENSWRVEAFINALKECRDSVEYYELTLENLNKFVKLPPKDEKILIESMQDKLEIKSLPEKLHKVL